MAGYHSSDQDTGAGRGSHDARRADGCSSSVGYARGWVLQAQTREQRRPLVFYVDKDVTVAILPSSLRTSTLSSLSLEPHPSCPCDVYRCTAGRHAQRVCNLCDVKHEIMFEGVERNVSDMDRIHCVELQMDLIGSYALSYMERRSETWKS